MSPCQHLEDFSWSLQEKLTRNWVPQHFGRCFQDNSEHCAVLNFRSIYLWSFCK
uniref:Uncharacterized protein n=1 Tax=Physcomitrium patens TaxID=3218 RepID=A0A2K1L9V9_PHYPA|nr:hypothetical protein PHYPA_001227 [Physcomitrium patens]